MKIPPLSDGVVVSVKLVEVYISRSDSRSCRVPHHVLRGDGGPVGVHPQHPAPAAGGRGAGDAAHNQLPLPPRQSKCPSAACPFHVQQMSPDGFRTLSKASDARAESTLAPLCHCRLATLHVLLRVLHSMHRRTVWQPRLHSSHDICVMFPELRGLCDAKHGVSLCCTGEMGQEHVHCSDCLRPDRQLSRTDSAPHGSTAGLALDTAGSVWQVDTAGSAWRRNRAECTVLAAFLRAKVNFRGHRN
jgi:hypothetical protein